MAPVPIEDAVKEELGAIVSNCMLIGDKKKFLSLLITLKVMYSYAVTCSGLWKNSSQNFTGSLSRGFK